jgi:hypothetical protein
MSEHAVQSNPPEAEGEKTIVLLLPQALGDKVDSAQLLETLKSSKDVRVLLCLTDPAGDAAANARMDKLVKALKDAITVLAQTDRHVEVQILKGAGVRDPDIHPDVIFRIPEGAFVDHKTAVKDQTEFALALSDAVLVAPDFVAPNDELERFLLTVEALGKQRLEPGKPVPALPALKDVTDGLDPKAPGRFGRPKTFFFFGRIEQIALELFAFNWLKGPKGATESRKQLRRCCGSAWPKGAYFAPDNWQESAPDSEAKETSKIIACFSALDRSALYGSHKHRDFVWMEYLGAAFAVLVAVAGHLFFHESKIPGVIELFALLFVVGLVEGSRSTHLQDRWTACRLGAEQLRIALMSLPLLVLPEALTIADKQPASETDDAEMEGEVDYGFKALQQVKRAVRQHGLPQLGDAPSPERAAAWVRLIIVDQIDYHDRNYRKLKHAEHRLKRLAAGIFVAAIIAVVAHFWIHWDALLLVTAAAPAFAAALHETGTHLGIVHRTALSFDMKTQLIRIKQGLDSLSATAGRWSKVRELAYDATKIMGSENKSWHGLVRRYRDEY